MSGFQIKNVAAKITVETDGGRMDFEICGPAKDVESMGALGEYIGKRASAHLEAFVGVDAYNDRIAQLRKQIVEQKQTVDDLKEELANQKMLADSDRVERLKAQRAARKPSPSKAEKGAE